MHTQHGCLQLLHVGLRRFGYFSVLAGPQPRQHGRVKTTADQQHATLAVGLAVPALRACVLHGPGQPARHHLLALLVAQRARRVAAQLRKVHRQALVQLVDLGLALEQVVPQRVGALHGHALGHGFLVGLPRLLLLGIGHVGVAVLHLGKRRVPGRQIAKADGRAHGLPFHQRLPFGRVRGKRRPGAAMQRAARQVAVNRHRQLVRQQQLVHAAVEIGRAFDQHMPGLELPDALAHQARASRAVVAHADDEGGCDHGGGQGFRPEAVKRGKWTASSSLLHRLRHGKGCARGF